MEFLLKNGRLEVKVNAKGAELVSLKRDGLEYMWQADPAYWGRTSPVLFPFVGSLYKKEYRHQGQVYTMAQHGFARDMEFSLVSRTDTKLVMALEETPETLAKYPFRFRLVLSYELSENTLLVGWQVTNTDEKPLHFSIGGHPAFNCPLGNEGAQGDYRLYFSKNNKPVERYTTSVIDGDGLVESSLPDGSFAGGYAPVVPELFDITKTLILENGQTDAVSLVDPSGRERVRVSFDMPIVGIWTPIEKKAPFICIEPWCGRCDRAGYTGELKDREWGNTLESGEVFQKTYSVSVF